MNINAGYTTTTTIGLMSHRALVYSFRGAGLYMRVTKRPRAIQISLLLRPE